MDSFDRLLDACARCLVRYENLVTDRAVLAAVSGGSDSTVLAEVLAKLAAAGRLPGPLRFCHVDHGVRPDSRETARHVEALANRLDVPLTVHRLLPHDRGGRTDEGSLRAARYRTLAAVAIEVGAGTVVTAHHADDNLETVLFRMLRGTGPRGLAGIPEARWIQHEGRKALLVRPFLRTRRSVLDAVRTKLGLRIHEDLTNADLRYARNRLRLETIPKLRETLGVGLDVTLMTVASTARAAAEIVEAQGLRILAHRARLRTPWRVELDLRGFEPDDPFVEEALRLAHMALAHGGEAPLRSWLARCLDLLHKPDGKRVGGIAGSRGGLLVERTRDGLLLVDPARAGAPPRLAPFAGEGASEGNRPDGQLFHWGAGRQRFGATEWWLDASEHPQPPLVPTPREAGRYRALLDPRTAPLPWRLRTRVAGDRFRPLGSERDVDLRRFLQSRHLPRFDRDRLPLLVDGNGRILWVPGVEVGEDARLRLNSRRTIELRAGCG